MTALKKKIKKKPASKVRANRGKKLSKVKSKEKVVKRVKSKERDKKKVISQKAKKLVEKVSIEDIKKSVEQTLKQERRRPESIEIQEPKVAIQRDGKISIARPEVQDVSDTMSNFSMIKNLIRQKLEKKGKSAVQDANRVATGIPGLDEAMEGGYLPKSINLVAGGPGTGKSIFAMNFLVNGIEQYKENGVYITFEQDIENILRDMEDFGWNIHEKIKKKELVIIQYTPEQVDKLLRIGAGTVKDIVRSIKAKRVVVDSITAFLLLHRDELEKRKTLLNLFKILKRWGITTVIISEQEQNLEKHESTTLEFEVDSVILLYNIKRGDVRQRALEILKMRATKHHSKIFPMQIGDNGIVIYPEESVF